MIQTSVALRQGKAHLTAYILGGVEDGGPRNAEPAAIKQCDPGKTNVIGSVSRDTVPLFLWHSRYDHMVPAAHSMKVAEKMLEYNRPFELHIFQSGDHMMSVNNRLNAPRGKQFDESVSKWVSLCDSWLRAKDSHH